MAMLSILGIDRHRMMTDGKGITSLVALAGCPLSCPYCINKELLQDGGRLKQMTAQELMEQLMIDHCYFLYTGGGVTFGGGEPLLQSEGILTFAEACPVEWNLTIETSLNVPAKQLESLLDGRFSFIIDVKAMQPQIYADYTGRENEQVIRNLQLLAQRIPQDKYVVKVPCIPGYSDEKDVSESKEMLQKLGIPEDNMVSFTYVV